jgi:hypothetical protein
MLTPLKVRPTGWPVGDDIYWLTKKDGGSGGLLDPRTNPPLREQAAGARGDEVNAPALGG